MLQLQHTHRLLEAMKFKKKDIFSLKKKQLVCNSLMELDLQYAFCSMEFFLKLNIILPIVYDNNMGNV